MLSIGKHYNETHIIDPKATTRVGRVISGGRGSEYECQCSGNVVICNKTILHAVANLIKCRQCKVYMLLSHGVVNV